jgi:hypothetical protein
MLTVQRKWLKCALLYQLNHGLSIFSTMWSVKGDPFNSKRIHVNILAVARISNGFSGNTLIF